MTRFEPGRELDYLIHRKVVGLCNHDWQRVKQTHRKKCSKCGASDATTMHLAAPHYSTDIGHAWQIVEKARLDGTFIVIAPLPDGAWIISEEKALNPHGDGTADGWDETWVGVRLRATTAAFGICLLSLYWEFEEGTFDEFLADCPDCGRLIGTRHAPDCRQYDRS